VELRCDAKILHGIVDEEDGTIEFVCRSRNCGWQPGGGVVVLHKFDVNTGALVKTTRLTEPELRR
jgi:hypothetical protein